MIACRCLIRVPRNEQRGRGRRCDVCDERGPMRVYELGAAKRILVAHWQCAVQVIAEAERLLAADIPRPDPCSP